MDHKWNLEIMRWLGLLYSLLVLRDFISVLLLSNKIKHFLLKQNKFSETLKLAEMPWTKGTFSELWKFRDTENNNRS